MNAPDLILAKEAYLVYAAGYLLDPASMNAEEVDRKLKDFRRASAVCPDCGEHEIPIAESHHVTCEFCDIEYMKLQDEMERNSGDSEKLP